MTPAGEGKQMNTCSVSFATAPATLNPLNSGLPDGKQSASTVSRPKDAVESSAAVIASCTSYRGERTVTLHMWLMFLANVVIVGSVNGCYIYSTLQSFSVESRVLIQYAGTLCGDSVISCNHVFALSKSMLFADSIFVTSS